MAEQVLERERRVEGRTPESARASERLYTAEAAADLAGVPYNTVLFWLRRGVVRPRLEGKIQKGLAVEVFSQADVFALAALEAARELLGGRISLDLGRALTTFLCLSRRPLPRYVATFDGRWAPETPKSLERAMSFRRGALVLCLDQVAARLKKRSEAA